MIVTLFSCLERASGFLYRIFLSRNMGAEGLGLYQIALSVIGVIITLSSSGIPITVSRLMIKDKAQKNLKENNTVTAGILTALLTSLPICIFCFLLKDKLTFIFADERCVNLFLAMLPGVVLTSIYAVIRGFFWGTKSFYTYAVIEFLEELVMIFSGLIFVSRATKIIDKAMWASYSVLISYIFSFALSSLFFVVKGGRIKSPVHQIKQIISSSAPITFMRTSNSFLSSLVALILPAILIFNGMSRDKAIAEFGIISGMTMPLLFIPSTIIGALALVLSPELSESFYKKNVESVRSNIEKSLLYCLLIVIFIIPIFVGCGKFIGKLLYNNEVSGIYLRNSAIIMIPMAVTMISTSLLNSIGQEKKTLIYFIISSITMILSIIVLPFFIGTYALITGYFFLFSLNAVLNIYLINKLLKGKLKFIKKILIAIPICLSACFLNYFTFNIIEKINGILAFLSASFLSSTFALSALLFFNVITINKHKSGAISSLTAS